VSYVDSLDTGEAVMLRSQLTAMIHELTTAQEERQAMNVRLKAAYDQIASLESQRDSAERNAADTKARVADLQTQRKMGPVPVINAISAAGEFWKWLSSGTAILLTTDDPNNETLRYTLRA
jgi:septal ring factor EnvC (AmiA/AmiB activator)